MASFTAVLWFRVIIMLRLTEQFGPLTTMIANMVVIVLKFLIIYLVGIITFASVATLTLSENPNFIDLFESIRQYLMASLGNFDLFQYDELEGWKRYYGIFLHIIVLFYNMLILVNLLIAIMSDEYASLSEVKTGLYWGSVIREIPKYYYSKYYGALTMLPFPLAWLNFFLIPTMILVKDKQTLKQIN